MTLSTVTHESPEEPPTPKEETPAETDNLESLEGLGLDGPHDIPSDLMEKAERFADLTSVRTRPGFTIAILIGSDLLMLLVAGAIAVFGWRFVEPRLDVSLHSDLLPFLVLFLPAYWALKLYPLVALSPIEELRRLFFGTSVVYTVLAASSFLVRGAEIYSRGVFLVGWALALFAVPLGRALVRHLFAPKAWWGYPVLVLGAGKTGEMVVRVLQKEPGLGLKPIGLLDDDVEKQSGTLCGIPILGPLEDAPMLAEELRMNYAIMAMPGVKAERLVSLLESYGSSFTHMLVIPDLFGFSSLAVPSKDVGGILSLEVRQQLLLPAPRFVKRFIELLGCIIGGSLILPIVLLIMLAIKLGSPGPIFYGHERIGRGGKKFKAWKFRSMHQNADKLLEKYLENRPDLREEWEQTQKLKNDPRVGSVGAILRKTSLDELPQVWNVLVGDMSVVGPRPIVEAEIARYDNKLNLYKRVRPGITGLWQVSGRSDTTYAERLTLDSYYVRNWSIWLDIYILARTVRVVLLGSGAY